jgi:hypothetical protein
LALKKDARTTYPQTSLPEEPHRKLQRNESQSGSLSVNKVWSHSEIAAFIEIICIDNDASTKAYLQHSFADLDFNNILRPNNKKGEAKTGKRNNKGKLKITTQHLIPGRLKPPSQDVCKIPICSEDNGVSKE